MSAPSPASVKRCPACVRTLDRAAFAIRPSRRDGLAPYCRTCSPVVARRVAKRTALGATRTGLVDATPVRAHLETLRRAGMTNHLIAEAAGLDRTIVRNVLDGQPPRQGPARRVRSDTATRLLAVTSSYVVAPSRSSSDSRAGATVDATGTRRRLQALMAIGWPAYELARRLGSTGGLQVARRPRVSSNTAAAVAALYRELENTTGPSSRSGRAARGWGYLPPGYWDVDTIDDPTYTPDGVQEYDARDRLVDDLTAPRSARVLYLAEQRGLSPEQIAERIGEPIRYVRRALREAS